MNTVIHGFDMEDTDYIHILHIVQCQKSYFYFPSIAKVFRKL